jgi:hypothetical protein
VVVGQEDQPRRDQQDVEQVGVALDALARVEDQSLSRRQVARVAVGDESVVRTECVAGEVVVEVAEADLAEAGGDQQQQGGEVEKDRAARRLFAIAHLPDHHRYAAI